jgi:hypothetical protein
MLLIAGISSLSSGAPRCQKHTPLVTDEYELIQLKQQMQQVETLTGSPAKAADLAQVSIICGPPSVIFYGQSPLFLG